MFESHSRARAASLFACRVTISMLFLLAAAAGTARAQDNSDCLMCHSDKSLTGKRAGRTMPVYVDEKKFGGSAHKDLPCVGCHADLDGKELPHEDDLKPVDCGTCHGDIQKLHARSLHGKALARGDGLAPRCRDCHGSHEIYPVKDPRSQVAPLRVPYLCGKCHQEGSVVMKQRVIHQDHILENYSESIHGEGLLRKGLIVAPNCASCHTAHSILPHTDPLSSISRRNISKTCANCHASIENVHRKVINGKLWEREAHVLPACVDCHQPHKVRKVFYTQSMANRDCLRCHETKGLRSSKNGHDLTVDIRDLAQSKHANVACSQCHSTVTPSKTRPCETITTTVDCASCHEEIGVQHRRSIHGILLAKNDKNAPTCKECHGTHHVRGKHDPSSPTFPTNIPALCGTCHREGEKAALRMKGEGRTAVAHYAESIHGHGLVKSGLTVTATCTNCHTSHQILPKSDPASSVNRANVPKTCGVCHHGIEEQFESSIHATMVGKTDKVLPVCDDCHSAHTIQRADADGFKLQIMQQCGRCHEKIAETYFDTYHGKVSLLGYTKTAKCYDCHGAHDILRVSDPKSHLSRENVVGTCMKCHPGANRRFAGYLTHATHHDPEKYPVLFYAFWGMTGLLLVTFFVGGVHTLLWLPRALQMRKARKAREAAAASPDEPSQDEPSQDA
ncbi:MAG: cytochrome c3 family protein [Ignavibacteriae bacterium]|nr:cytochrome c3 family protein [Ignavibacteriota bacterium]